MQEVWKPLYMAASFDKEGNIKLMRFQLIAEDESEITVSVDRMLTVDQIREDKVNWKIYKVEVSLNGQKKKAEIRFNMNTCQWFLTKI
jgi:hypothetical protein